MMSDKEHKLRILLNKLYDKCYLQIYLGYQPQPRYDKLDNKSALFDIALDDILTVMNKEL